jgi:hypothetical protein
MTARSFRARFNQVTEPVLVNDGIWFPKTSPELLALADGKMTMGFAVTESHMDGDIRIIDKVELTAVGHVPNVQKPPQDFSKASQAKGKMGR